ncbi:transposase family protein [Streptomyces sp. NPDC002659]|uniref:transposase family protein n=1 Tax=Streptomyces sp. NPDC002659 TaxID=3364656 RepID=UPI0036CF586B
MVGVEARGLILSERRVTGLFTVVIADLVPELGPVWQARRDAELADRPRKRAAGAGAKYTLVFVDRLLATLVHLRQGVTHDVLACWSRWTAPRSRVRSGRSGLCSPAVAVASRVVCGCGPLLM